MSDTTIISTKSTYVASFYPDFNNGDLAYIIGGREDAAGYLYILVELDLATCPPVKTALTYLNPYAIYGTGCNGVIERNTASWTEATVTWNTKPASTGNYGTINLISEGAKSVDITNLVKEWKAGTYPNYGFTITNTMGYGNYAQCRSDDYATEAERPRLVITPETPSGFFLFLCEAFERHNKLWTPKLILPKEGYAICQ